MDAKSKSRVQEELLSLYLRLNGFFVTGFIVHSPIHGQNVAEIDVLAVRFPYNKEPERQVEPDPLIEVSDQLVDVVICEVKSRGQQLQFNRALVATPEPIARLLRWAGMFQETDIAVMALQVQLALAPTNPARSAIPCVLGAKQTRVRGLLCSPERNKRRNNQAWFLSGPAMFSFISRCLCPPVPRSTCATRYDFGLWGTHESIVRYFKERGAGKPDDMEQLYEYLQKGL